MHRLALRKALEYDKKEIITFFYNALIGGAILYLFSEVLRQAGLIILAPFDPVTNMILYMACFLAFYAQMIFVQKYVAAYKGYEVKYTGFLYGPIIGFGASVMTYGALPFIYLGAVQISKNERLRLGQHFKAINASDLLFIASAGLITTLFLIIFVFEPLYLLTGFPGLRIVLVAGAAVLFYSTLPLPKSNGANILLKSRIAWFFSFVFSFLVAISILLVSPYLYLLILSISFVIVILARRYFSDVL